MRGPYMTWDAAAGYLGMSVKTLRRKVKQYDIPAYCEGKKFSAVDLDAWAEDPTCFKRPMKTGKRPAGGFTLVTA